MAPTPGTSRPQRTARASNTFVPTAPEAPSQLITDAVAMAMDLVHKSQPKGGPTRWRVRSDERGVKLYEASHFSNTECTFMATVEVMGTLHDVVTVGLDLDHTFGLDISNSTKLRKVVPAHYQTSIESLHLTWREYKPLAGAKYDSTLLQSTQRFSKQGRHGVVMAYKSYDVPKWQQPQHGFQRIVNQGSGVVCTESSDQPGTVTVRFIAHIQLPPSTRSTLVAKHRHWVCLRRVLRWCQSASLVAKRLRDHRLRTRPPLIATQFVPKGAHHHCFLCRQAFRWLHRRKTNCWGCGEVVCSSCTVPWHPGARPDSKQRLCAACSVKSAGSSNTEDSDIARDAFEVFFETKTDFGSYFTTTRNPNEPTIAYGPDLVQLMPEVDKPARVTLIDEDLADELYALVHSQRRPIRV